MEVYPGWALWSVLGLKPCWMGFEEPHICKRYNYETYYPGFYFSNTTFNGNVDQYPTHVMVAGLLGGGGMLILQRIAGGDELRENTSMGLIPMHEALYREFLRKELQI